MSKRAFLIGLISMLFLCMNAQERYDFTFRNITIDEAFFEIEDKADISIVYNPRELSANKRISLTVSGLTAGEAIRKILGADYRVLAKNGIYTIKKAAPAIGAIEAVEEIAAIGTIATIDSIDEIVADTIEEIAAIDTIDAIDTIEAKEAIDTIESALAQPVKQEKPQKSKKPYLATDHRVMVSLAAGVGGIYLPGCATTIFDAQYAYFFHENWGIAAGAGINYFGHSQLQSETQILTAYFPITFRMDYRLSERLRLIGGAGASLELPIDGVYATDENGQRYGESLLYGALVDIGVAVPLARTRSLIYALGISAYGQCLFESSGLIKNELQHQGLYPWQTGLRLTLMLNIDR